MTSVARKAERPPHCPALADNASCYRREQVHVASEQGTTTRPRGWVVVRCALTLTAILAPLKFGTVVGVSEISLFPTSGWDWVLGSWPPFFMPAFSGGCLLVTLCVYPVRRVHPRTAIIPGIWALLLLALLPGLLRTTEWDAALLLLWHVLGVVTYVLAVWVAIQHDDGVRRCLVAGVVVGTLLACRSGWWQKLWGLEETLRFAEEQARRLGLPPPEALRSRVEQGRAFGPFVYPNSFAAHLLLTGPLVLLTLGRWGGHFSPTRVSRTLFLGVGVLALGGALWFSSSRAGMLALGFAVVAGTLVFPPLRRWRLPVVLACFLAASALFILASRGRSKINSLTARGHYYTGAARMFADHPVTGVGLGEFFPNYMRLKPPNTEEARLPHNMVLNCASQAGVLAALAACLCLGVPVVLALRRLVGSSGTDDVDALALLIGLLGWGTHTLLDFNFQIPGTLMLAAAMPLYVPVPSREAAEHGACPDGRAKGVRSVLVGMALLSLASLWRVPGEMAYQRLHSWYERPQATVAYVERLAEDAAARLPLSPYPWALLGRTARRKGQSAVAVRAFEEACRVVPHRSAYQRLLCESLLRVGDVKSAREALERALEWYPHDPDIQALQRRFSEL